MKTVRVGLIGLGFMGSYHFRIHQGLPNVEVTAIADVDPVKRSGDLSAVSGNLGDDETGVYDFSKLGVYEDGFRLIAEADVDVVDICVPTPFHQPYAVAALKAGKHVFCEKPVCRNLAQLTELEQAVKASDRYFNVGMCLRTWPEYMHARELYRSGRLGKLHSAAFRRLSPSVAGNGWQDWFCKEELSGGAILDLHLHDADAVCHFFGAPKAVSSFGVRGVVSDHGIDHVQTRYDFGDGALVTAEGGWDAAKAVGFEMSFRLVAEKATIIYEPAVGYKVFWTDGKVEAPDFAGRPSGWELELAYFTDCVRDGVKPDQYQTPESIFAAFRVVMAEITSVDRGEAVEVKYV